MEADIRQAVYGRVHAFSQAENVPVYWPNKGVLNAASRHLRVHLMNITPDHIGQCSGSAVWGWIVQVSVYIRSGTDGIDGADDMILHQLVDKVRKIFSYGQEIKTAEADYIFTKPANVISPVPDDGWYFVPVQFNVKTIH